VETLTERNKDDYERNYSFQCADRDCAGLAQQYSLGWQKVAGSGGISSGGTYQVSGTIGQPDASGAMTGGSYSFPTCSAKTTAAWALGPRRGLLG